MPRKTFGTLTGVFTPTTLTILGVIMYIRYPWVVGNAGILGAMAILGTSVLITLTTALSLSSITTNVKIGTGGAFSVISKSLGLEIGGAIGIPFYLAQAFAVTMYIFGFREGVHMLFPEVNAILVDLLTFAVVVTISMISTGFAFRAQFVILGIIVLSIGSICGGFLVNEPITEFQLFGSYPGSPENGFSGGSFWLVFAVFFPAVTGVMAGANMSGDLTAPRQSIPRGTISAVLVTAVVYLGLIFVAAMLATPEELVTNYNVFIEKSLFPPLVLVGLLGATLSSALGSFVGAPRILVALGEKEILPKGKHIAKLSSRGEPVTAMIITAVFVLFGITFRNLNTIAPLLTMFFMITYAMVNVVALIEQLLALPSYRPTLKIPLLIPLIGTFGCISVMFIINPFFALISLILIVAFYVYLVGRPFESPPGDSRSGLFTAVAEWSTKKTTELSPDPAPRSWRPDLLIPIMYPREIRSSFKLIESIVHPKGSIKLVAIRNDNPVEQERLENFIPLVMDKFREINIPISSTTVDNYNFNNSLNISMQALNAAFFKPNTILATIDTMDADISHFDTLIDDVHKNSYGLVYYIPFTTASLAIQKSITLWISNLPRGWNTSFDLGNNDLAILMSVLISRNWKGVIKVNIIDNNDAINEEMLYFFRNMVRFPASAEMQILSGELNSLVLQEQRADLNIISIPDDLHVADMVGIVIQSRISAVFCLDSEYESALV